MSNTSIAETLVTRAEPVSVAVDLAGTSSLVADGWELAAAVGERAQALFGAVSAEIVLAGGFPPVSATYRWTLGRLSSGLWTTAPLAVGGHQVGLMRMCVDSNRHVATETRFRDFVRSVSAAAHNLMLVRNLIHAAVPGTAAHMAADRRQTELDLRGAVGRDELVVEYQPLIDLVSGDMVGVEALVRWDHRHHGRLLPGAFIDVAEESGLVNDIGRFVIDDACRRVAQWQETRDGFYVAVNLSPRQILDGEVGAVLIEALNHNGADPRRICLEVTETALLAHSGAAALLADVNRLGVKVALDDFGTGFSSLSHLQVLPVDVVKVDRAFISAIEHSDRDQELVAGIAGLAHRLGVSVVAEGVETRAQLVRVADAGCDSAQGFYFARPGPPDRITAALAATPGLGKERS